jgi:hypothetical protein
MNVPSTCYAAIVAAHGLLMLILGWRVIRFRQTKGVGIGDGGEAAFTRRIRAHANLTEWAPMTLIALLVVDLRGAGPYVVGGIGGALLVGRVMHAIGLTRSSGVSQWRIVGMVLTLGALLAASICAVLCWGSCPA